MQKIFLFQLLHFSFLLSVPLEAREPNRLIPFIKEQRYSDLLQMSLSEYANHACDLSCQTSALLTASVSALHMSDFSSAHFYLKLVNPETYTKTKWQRLHYVIDLKLGNAAVAANINADSILSSQDKSRLRTYALLIGEKRQAQASIVEVARYFAENYPNQAILYESYTRASARHYSVPLAGGLALIPGGGFAYLGMYQSAAISFFLSSLMMITTSELAKGDNPAAATAAGILGSVFYVGSIFSSIESAYDLNDAMVSPQRRKMIRILLPELNYRF